MSWSTRPRPDADETSWLGRAGCHGHRSRMAMEPGTVPAEVLLLKCATSARTANGYLLQNEDKQTMNTSIYLLFIIGIAFYCEMRRRMSTMGML
jgi:hypothetical protein